MAYKVFVSHVWRAQHQYYAGLIRLLDEAKYFNFRDLSVPRTRALDGGYEQVKDEIFESLRESDVVLVVNTPVVGNSKPVQEELEEANRLGIPIIAIRPPKRHGRPRESQLLAIQRATKTDWTTKSIVSAIRTHARRGAAARAANSEKLFEPVSEAVSELPLSKKDLVEVRGDDEAPNGETSIKPRDVLRNESQNINQFPTAPKRSWLNRLLGRH